MSQEPESKFSSFLAARRQPASDATPVQERTRPTGKRRDPAFEQVTAYIRKATHRSVKLALLKEGNDRQFSDLVEELLATWLGSNQHT